MQRLSLKFHVGPFLLAVFFTVILITSFYALGLLVNQVAFIQRFDRYFYEAILNGPHPAWLNAIVAPFNFNFIPGVPAAFLSFLVILVPLCLAIVFIYKRKDFGWALLACVVALVVDQIVAQVLPFIFFRPRPFVTLPNTLTQAAISIWTVWPSFPSGHTRDTTVLMTTLAAFMPKATRWVLAVFCLFIAWSRIYVGAHFPTDVIAGLLAGYFMGLIALSLIEKIRKTREEKKQQQNEAVQQAAT